MINFFMSFFTLSVLLYLMGCGFIDYHFLFLFFFFLLGYILVSWIFFISILTFNTRFVKSGASKLFFNLLSMNLSWSHNPCPKFNRLVWINLSFFFIFSNWFFIFYSLALNYLKIKFNFFFYNFFSIRWSYLIINFLISNWLHRTAFITCMPIHEFFSRPAFSQLSYDRVFLSFFSLSCLLWGCLPGPLIWSDHNTVHAGVYSWRECLDVKSL